MVRVLVALVIAATVVPLAAWIGARRTTGPSERWMAFALAVMFAVDMATWIVAHLQHRTLGVWYVSVPVVAIAVLLGLAGFQRTRREQVTVWGLVAVYAIGYPVLFFDFESADTFSKVTQPATALLVMSVAAATLARRIQGAPDDEAVASTHWFWLCLGWALYYGMSAALMPISRLLVGDDPRAVLWLFGARAVYDIGIYLLLAWGFTCARRATSSGSSQWPLERSPS